MLLADGCGKGGFYSTGGLYSKPAEGECVAFDGIWNAVG